MLDRRKPGQLSDFIPAKGENQVEFLSGIMDGIALGTPIGFIIRNKDAKPVDYDHLKEAYRPSHARFAWDAKFGIETIAVVVVLQREKLLAEWLVVLWRFSCWL